MRFRSLYRRLAPSRSHCHLALLGLLIVSLPGIATAGKGGGGPWRILASDAKRLVVEVAPGPVTWTEVIDTRHGRRYLRPHLAGFARAGEPGTPEVPAVGGWIVVPEGTRPRVVTGEIRWRPLSAQALPPVPVRVIRGEGERPQVTEELLWRGESPSGGRVAVDEQKWSTPPAGPVGVLTVGTPVRWRDRWIAPLSCRPLETDARGHAVRLLERGRWEIVFDPDPDRESAPATRVPGRGDDRFQGLFLNGELLEQPPRAAGPLAERPVERLVHRGTLLAPEVRLPVSRTGLQRITASQLANAGLLPATGVQESQLRLYQRRVLPGTPDDYVEVEVPLLVQGDGGEFTGNEAIVFYGLRPRDDGAFTLDGTVYPDCGDTNEFYNPVADEPVNGGNIYYLAVSEPPAGQQWARMDTVSLPPAAAEGAATHLRDDRHEVDLYYDESPYGMAVDRNFWNSRFASEVRVPLELVAPAATGARPWLEVKLFGFGPTMRTYQVSVVGPADEIVLGTVQVNNAGAVFADSIPVASAADLDGWDLRIVNTAADVISGYLDWFRIVYPSRYEAVDDRLEFGIAEGTGTVDVRVRGFDGGPLTVFEVSDPRRPRLVQLGTGNVVGEQDGSLTLSLAVAQSGTGRRRFLAYGLPLDLALPTFPIFQASQVPQDDDPLAVASPPDVLVVTHPSFRQQAEQWAAWRAGRYPGGLRIHVVDVHALYDRFSGGLKNPLAIRRFCEYALANWGSWALQIFGDATENVRGLHDTYGLRDWVPSYLFVWRGVTEANEVLPSDEWYVTPAAGPDYPYDTGVPPSMLVGRFPVSSSEELQVVLDKLRAFEAADGGQAWKQRGVFIADDAWSDQNYSIGYDDLSYIPSEEQFQETESAFADAWETFLGDGGPAPGLVADRLFVADYLEPLSPPHNETRSRTQFEEYSEQYVLPELLAKLGQGGMIVRYQGHANNHLLAHEQIFEDVDNIAYRQDVQGLQNDGRPFLFFGLGCHIGAYALGNSEGRLRVTRSLAEKMLLRPGGGACGTYASPGYEYLWPNATLAGIQRDVMLLNPPRSLLSGETGTRTRWVLGELMLASEMSFLAISPSSTTYRRAVAQYAVLGDALTVLDAGPPRVVVDGPEGPLTDGMELTAVDTTSSLLVTVDAYDEAGVSRLVVRTGDGIDYSEYVTGGMAPGSATDQHHQYTVRLPLEPYDHDIVFEVFDTADASETDAHYRLVLHVPVSVALTSEGVPFDPQRTPLVPGQPRAFTGTVTVGAYLPPDVEIVLAGEYVVLGDVAVARLDAHTVSLAFTAEATGLGTPVLKLRIAGRETPIALGQEMAASGPTVTDLQAFPNPMRETVRFLFATSLASAEGWIDLYSLAGRHVARVPVAPSDFAGGGRAVVGWDGRDDRGDRLANGVYLYRVTLRGSDGDAVSGMQRLVVMH